GATRWLAKDHVSPVVGEETPTELAGDPIREVEDANPVEGRVSAHESPIRPFAELIVEVIASGRAGEPVAPTSLRGLNTNRNSRHLAAARLSRSRTSMMWIPASYS